MPVVASPARHAAVALSLAACLAASVARAEPPPASSLSPEPPITLRPRPDPVLLELGVRLGGGFRLGDAPSFPVASRTGSVVGAGVTAVPSSRFSIGLWYEHSELGTEHGEGDLGNVDVDRSLDALWATLRLNLFRVDGFALTVLLGPGLVWQSEDTNAFLFDGTSFQPDALRCSATDGPGLGLRAGLGAELHLGDRFVLNLDGTADELRLSSDALGTCAPGAGSTAVIGVRGGLSYRLDVSRYLR